MNWISCVSVALDRQSENVKLGVSDIQIWLQRERIRQENENRNSELNSTDSTYYMPGDNEYDSDTTEKFLDKYPNEDRIAMMWVCEKNCYERTSERNRFYIHDRFICLPCLQRLFSNSYSTTLTPDPT